MLSRLATKGQYTETIKIQDPPIFNGNEALDTILSGDWHLQMLNKMEDNKTYMSTDFFKKAAKEMFEVLEADFSDPHRKQNTCAT